MLIDVNTSLGHWPFMRFEQDTAGKLADHLASAGVDRALVSATEAALFPDPHIPNGELFAALVDQAVLMPLPTIDPTLSHWRDCLDTYALLRAPNAARVLPNYHRYTLDAPCVDDLASALLERGKAVLVVQMRLEDERNQYPLMQVPGVPADDVLGLARRHPDLAILCLCPYLHEAVQLLNGAPNLHADIAFVELLDTLATFVSEVSSDRVFFGSHTPFLYTRANLMKVEQATVDTETLAAVTAGNAARLFGLE